MKVEIIHEKFYDNGKTIYFTCIEKPRLYSPVFWLVSILTFIVFVLLSPFYWKDKKDIFEDILGIFKTNKTSYTLKYKNLPTDDVIQREKWLTSYSFII